MNWSREYDPVVNRAFHVFLAFVEGWYRRDVERIFFAERKLERIRRFITSILGGNVLREDNPLAANPVDGLRQLHRSIGETSVGPSVQPGRP